MQPTGPLSGTTVVDLSFMGPGPRCTSILADYGASVVKVGPVPTKFARQITPPAYAYSGGRGTRRMGIDLKDATGPAAFLALAAGADVVVESFRPGVADRLGIGYRQVVAHNRAVVYCSITGYATTGERADWAGHDLNYLAVGGYLAAAGRTADGRPALPGSTVADAAAGGMHAALAVTTALVGRGRTGDGAHLRVSAEEGVVWLCSLMVDEYLATGVEARPAGGLLTGRYACYDTYATADGEWVAVGAIEAAFFANLCQQLGCGHLAGRQFDDGAQDEIRSAFATAFATGTRDEWVARLAAADTCVAPVRSIAEVAADPTTPVVDALHPGEGLMRQLGPLLAGMEPVREPVALPGVDDSDAGTLLREAGVDAGTIEAWLARAVVA